MRRFQDFVGTWNVTRSVDDKRAQSTFEFQGTATISEGLYQESGQMILTDGTALNAERKYLWDGQADGINVSFADGKFFHFIAYTACTHAVHHLCIHDDYSGLYDFSDFPDWSVNWAVTGPAKKYTSVTNYRRM